MIDHYLSVIADAGVALPSTFHGDLVQAEAVRKALGCRPQRLVACHCDPVCENFLDTGDRMWLVDWEYSGMSDPMWDLADLSVEAEFDTADEDQFLQAYFGREPTADERGRVTLFKAMTDLLWTLWGLLQVANNNPTGDYESYARNRLDRCEQRMLQPAFGEALRAVCG